VQALPTDIQAAITKHADAAALAQREDVAQIRDGRARSAAREGHDRHRNDTSGFPPPSGAFYARWKGIYGEKAWALLEARVGKARLAGLAEVEVLARRRQQRRARHHRRSQEPLEVAHDRGRVRHGAAERARSTREGQVGERGIRWSRRVRDVSAARG